MIKISKIRIIDIKLRNLNGTTQRSRRRRICEAAHALVYLEIALAVEVRCLDKAQSGRERAVQQNNVGWRLLVLVNLENVANNDVFPLNRA